MKTQTDVLVPEEIEVDLDTPKKSISLKCDKHPDKCELHHLKFGQKMKWRSKKGNRFSIFFEPGRTPFEEHVLTYEQATTGQVAIHEGGPFKYTVRDDSDDSNFLDPEIVVDPPKGGDE